MTSETNILLSFHDLDVCYYLDMTKTENTQEMVTVPCWKCGGTGTYAHGVCYGCWGATTNTYTAAHWKRRQAAAKGRATRDAMKREDEQAAQKARFAAMTVAQIELEVPEMVNLEEDGTVGVWGDFPICEVIVYISVTEYATKLHNGTI